MRLIDADLLTTEIIKISGVIPNFNEDVALCSVDSMPTVRAVPLVEFMRVQKQLILRNAQLLEAEEKMKSMVPVVRCGECKYSRDLNTREKEIFVDVCLACENNDASQHGYMIVFPDHFCSYGERRKLDEEK